MGRFITCRHSNIKLFERIGFIMNNFVSHTSTLFAFGDGQEKTVGDLVRRFGGTKVLLIHYGGDFIKLSCSYDEIVAALNESGMPFAELADVMPNPRSDKVYEGIEIARREGCDFMLAIGGGSTIDTAKAIALGVNYDGDFWDFFTGKTPVTSTLPVGSVLTIAAAGSEGSSHCVITHTNGNLKWGVPPTGIIRPKFAILNPRYTASLPKFQIACGAVDMISHVCERYFTNTKDVELTDRISEAVMKAAVDCAKRAVADRNDAAALADLMWIGNLSQNESTGVGRAQDWASHLIEHELSAVVECAHGAGLAVIMPAWMEFVMNHDVLRFARFAVEVFGCEMSYEHPERTAREGIARFRAFCKGLGLPTTLAELGVKEEDIPTIVAHREAKPAPFPFGQFVPIGPDEMAAVLKIAL